jgi:D-sedoheptulose 7-phosphate isomerase
MKTSDFKNYFNRVSDTLVQLDINALEKVADLLLACRENGNTVYIFGNGGSASTASHVTGDFLKGISYQLEKRFRIICLNDNIAAMTAIANDLSYEEVFVEQLQTFMKKDDVVIGISGSGNSANVVRALEFARDNNAVTIALTGYTGGKLKDIVDIMINAPIKDMEVTEDIHIIIFHAIKQELIRKIKGENYSMGYNYDQRVKQ